MTVKFQQLAFVQQQQQRQQFQQYNLQQSQKQQASRHVDSVPDVQLSNDNDIFKWFEDKGLPSHSSGTALPIPKHAAILTLDDIEH